MIVEAKEFFAIAVESAPDHVEAVACVGYSEHRLGEDDAAIATLRRALRLDADYVEARIYLGNILYDRGEYEAALHHLDKSRPEDHWDELGIWRLIELKKSIYKLRDNDPELRPWEERVQELAGEPDDIDELLAEIEAKALEEGHTSARGQLELFGALLTTLSDVQEEALFASQASLNDVAIHRIVLGDRAYEGTWDEIVRQMRDQKNARVSVEQYMATEARRGYGLTGVEISSQDAESFIRGSADAGLLRIDK
jgi:tetratricopeptide (TPR) repeat protein